MVMLYRLDGRCVGLPLVNDTRLLAHMQDCGCLHPMPLFDVPNF